MIKKLYLPLLLLMVVAFSSCSKKMGALSSDYFTTTPQVLEAVAGQVPVTINGQFPAKYFKKKAVVEVTPVLRWDGGEAVGTPAVFQGEKVEGNDPTISYKLGGNYTMRTSFTYVPEMAKSELYLVFNAKVGKKTVNIPAVKIADGVIATSELINNTLESANLANGDDAFQRIIKDQFSDRIMFLINSYDIRPAQMKNASTFNTEALDVYDAPNKQITSIDINSTSSPDGGYELNDKLSKNRMNATEKVVDRNMKKSKIEAPVDASFVAQDWEGFQELVSQSNLQDKELILRVLSMYRDPATREQEIKNMAAIYEELANSILPQLRFSRLTLNYEIIGKSDEEIILLFQTNPGELNIEEILYAATLTKNPSEQEAIFLETIKLYPNDYRAYNNLGKLAFQQGNYDVALAYFNKANSVESAPEVNMNLGIMALLAGDQQAAEAFFGKAAGAPELNEALGNLYVMQGQYERAVNAFGDTATNSAALAQILAKDYNKANQTLLAVPVPNAYTDYLMAVLAARTNNVNLVTTNLSSAIQRDPSLAKKAATDLEFAKYYTNTAFINTIK